MSHSSTLLQLDSRNWMSQSTIRYGIAPGQWNSIQFVSSDKFKSKKSKKFKEILISIRHYIFSDGRYFGRTKLDFLKLLIFYALFYCFLALILASLLTIFIFGTVSNYKPKLTGDNSMLKMNPGLSIIPSPDHLSSLIHFNTGRKFSYRRYMDQLVAFTSWYQDQTIKSFSGNAISVECNDNTNTKDFNFQKICHFDLNIGGQCNLYDDYGYDDGLPCFAIKLNRIYGWIPEPLDNETGVIIKCDGLSDQDRDAMGDLCYFDSDTLNKPNDFCKSDRGVLKHYYFPYLKQASYESPFVFIKFLNPKRKVVIMMQCRAIAKNIEVDISRRIGAMTFELLID